MILNCGASGMDKALKVDDAIETQAEAIAQLSPNRDVRTYDWRWNQNPVSIVYEVMGKGLDRKSVV